MIWRPNGLNHLALIGVTMSNPHVTRTTQATVDQFEPIAPRTRINVKQLANGKWQAEYTCESFDADPLTDEGWTRINARLQAIGGIVDDLLASKEAPLPN